MNVDVAALTQIAAAHNIPPSILNAIATHGGGSMRLNDATVGSYGLSASDLNGNDSLQLELAARTLQSSFSQYGSWEKALSDYLTGDPNAYQSPTSSVGGFVYAVLGTAAANPHLGMQGFMPSDPSSFRTMAHGLADHMEEIGRSGGVVSPFAGGVYRQQVQTQFPPTSGGSWNTTIVNALASASQNNAQSYTPEQCTWYAARSLGYIPGGLGDAKDWAHNAAEKGMSVGMQAKAGDAVVYGAGGNYSGQYGHVAVVQSVNPDGTFTISEMNFDGQGVVDTRVSSMNGVIGFISPPAGTDMATAVPGLKTAVQTNPVTPRAPQPAQPSQPQATAPSGPTIKPPDPTLNPKEVDEFAQQMQGMNADVGHFQQHFGFINTLTQRFLQRGATLDDYRAMQAMSPQQMTEYVRSLPHPTYPEVTAGALADRYNATSLHSVSIAGRTPYLGEAARLQSAGAGWKETADFYRSLTTGPLSGETATPQQQQPAAAGQPSPTHGALA